MTRPRLPRPGHRRLIVRPSGDGLEVSMQGPHARVGRLAATWELTDMHLPEPRARASRRHAMTSRSRQVAAAVPDDVGSQWPPPSTSTPEGHSLAPPAAGYDQRVRTAIHEAGHTTALVHLLGADSVCVASIGQGRGHAGITLLGDRRPTDRRERELDIVATLAGDAAVMAFGLLESGYHAPTPDEVASEAAVTELEKLSPLGRERLLAAEAAEPDPDRSDESVAWNAARSISDWDATEAGAHLIYLRIVAEGFAKRHGNAIRKVAHALLEHETLDGVTAAELVRGTRCVCHGWTPPPDKEA